jgi:hypothetical protein
MAAFEVIALDTATPQLRAPGASDTYTFPRAVEMPLGTANGVLYLDGSKVVTSGSALTFDGTNLAVGTANPLSSRLYVANPGVANLIIGYNNTSVNYLDADTQIFRNSSATEQMRLDSTGLGIGTSSPGNKLHVQGSGDVARFTNGTNSAYFALDSAGFTLFTGAGQTGNGLYAKASDNSVQLWTNSSVKATLDSSGNLGLGVTPSAWASTSRAIQLAASSSLEGRTNDGSYVALYSNATWNGTNFIYQNTATAAYYKQSSSVHSWHTAPVAGTAGDPISFTQAMTLDASGNLGIGTTSPGSKLNVVGTTAGIGYLAGIVLSDNATTTVSLGLQTPGGSDLPFVYGNSGLGFGTNSVERARITSGGNFKIGGSADRATTEGDKQLVLFDGTAPVGTLANGVSFYSASGEANVMDAAGNATLLSPHDAETNEWIFRSKHTPTGKVLKIDVERLLKFVNDHFGLDAVHEFIEA